MKKDIEIANDALNALNANYSIPQSKITVKVEKGWITLEGELPWNYEIEAAISAVSYITGVKGVTSHMTIKLETGNPIEKKEI